jgi:peptidyl-prolyl cis-trans isomerase A (cyclophilin A)
MKFSGLTRKRTGLQKCLAAATAVSLSLILIAGSANSVHANTLVRVSTSYGDFTLELFDEETPHTVANFLRYVDRGDYSGSVIHRLEPGFVVQGGAWRWFGDCLDGVVPPNCGPIQIPVDPPVINEPGISNVRGTIAMAKLGGDPNSATSQWFINLADNSEVLDEQNEGFTVFGRVLGDGMNSVDPINSLTPYPVSEVVAQIPLRNYAGAAPVGDNLVHMNMYRVQRHSSAMHVFEMFTLKLGIFVNTDQFGPLSLQMNLVEDTPNIVFEVEPRGIIPLASEFEGMASFSSQDLLLRIPQVEINDMGNVYLLNNLIMRLVDDVNLRFILESFDE